MLVFVGGFVVGIIAGIAGIAVIAKHACNMSWDEMSHVGAMLNEAGNNRVSTITLCTNDGQDTIVFSVED